MVCHNNVILRLEKYHYYVIKGQSQNTIKKIKDFRKKYLNSKIIIRIRNHPNPIKFNNKLFEELEKYTNFKKIDDNRFKINNLNENKLLQRIKNFLN